MTVTASSSYEGQPEEITLSDIKLCFKGSFGVIHSAFLNGQDDLVAVKKVLQDRRYKNRELSMMAQLNHQNILLLRYYFYLSGESHTEHYLYLVFDYIPDTVDNVVRFYRRNGQRMPFPYVLVYSYQMFRALAFLHSLHICHRDVKPQNLLIDPQSGVLKVCDFGSAKQLDNVSESNTFYIGSRFYRAPELLLGSLNYTYKIDMWSAGCVLAEMLLGQPIFAQPTCPDQLVEIVKALGSPTLDQMHAMNAKYRHFQLPHMKPIAWPTIFPPSTSPHAMHLVDRLLRFTPDDRLSGMACCAHRLYDELRQHSSAATGGRGDAAGGGGGATLMPNGKPIPPLFNFSAEELSIQPELRSALQPRYAVS